MDVRDFQRRVENFSRQWEDLLEAFLSADPTTSLGFDVAGVYLHVQTAVKGPNDSGTPRNDTPLYQGSGDTAASSVQEYPDHVRLSSPEKYTISPIS